MIRLVTGPPASGKSTYVRENAKPTDAIIDLDLLDGDSALRAALEESLHLKGSRTDVWVCRTLPDPKDRNGFAEYIQADEVVLLDDSTEDELIARLEGTEDAEDRIEGIRRWFSLNPRNGERKETKSMSENSTAPEALQPVAEELSTPASEDVQAQVEELKKQVEQWKSHSRTWEKRAKESQHNTGSEQTNDGEQLKNLQEEFATFKRESALRIAESEIRAGLSGRGLSNLQGFFDGLGAASFLNDAGDFDKDKFESMLSTLAESVKPQTANGIPSLSGAPASEGSSKNSFASGAAAFRAKQKK
nr:MAG TPA: Adenylylsulfate kinase [Caudoviricetes sp.]